MDANTVLTVIAAGGAVLAACGAWCAVPYFRRAAEAAESQTKLQIELEKQRAQPYVWADIQPDAKQGTLVQIVVGNAGPTVASNVRVTIDPPFAPPALYPGSGEVAQRRLASGIRSLTPGRFIEWSAGRGFDVLEDDTPQVHTIRVTADGPHGPVTPLEFEVNLSDWRESRDSPDGSLHLLRDSVKDLTQEVRSFRESYAKLESTRLPRTPIVETSRSDAAVRQVPTRE